MPKLKKSPMRQQMETVSANILARGAYFGCKSDGSYAKRLCIKESTFRTRRHDPSLWRLDELIRAAEQLKCSLAWLVTDHSIEG